MYYLYTIIKQVNNLGWLESWLIFNIWFQQYCVWIIYYYQTHNKITHTKSKRICLLEEAECDGSNKGHTGSFQCFVWQFMACPFFGEPFTKTWLKKSLIKHVLLLSTHITCYLLLKEHSRFNLISSWYSLLALTHNSFPRCWQGV